MGFYGRFGVNGATDRNILKSVRHICEQLYKYSIPALGFKPKSYSNKQTNKYSIQYPSLICINDTRNYNYNILYQHIFA